MQTSELIQNELKYAGFWIRSWAVSIDSLVIMVMGFVSFFAIGSMVTAPEFGMAFSDMVMRFLLEKMQSISYLPVAIPNAPPPSIEAGSTHLEMQFTALHLNAANIFILVQVVFCTLYYAIPESSRMQGSIGKYLMGVKIVGLDGEKIGFWRAFARNMVKIFSGYFNFLLSVVIYITIPFDAKKRGLHDMACKTFVVYRD